MGPYRGADWRGGGSGVPSDFLGKSAGSIGWPTFLARSLSLSTPERTRYIWRFEDVYLGVEASGVGDAGSSERQSLQISFQAPNDRLPGVDSSKATTKLHIDVERNGERVKRDAVITLRWEGPEKGYRVVGLKH